jgi:hypothetical protein
LLDNVLVNYAGCGRTVNSQAANLGLENFRKVGAMGLLGVRKTEGRQQDTLWISLGHAPKSGGQDFPNFMARSAPLALTHSERTLPCLKFGFGVQENSISVHYHQVNYNPYTGDVPAKSRRFAAFANAVIARDKVPKQSQR